MAKEIDANDFRSFLLREGDFSDNNRLSRVIVYNSADFDNLKIVGPLFLNDVEFRFSFSLHDCVLEGEIHFENCTFPHHTWIRCLNSKENGSVFIRGGHWSGNIVFDNVNLNHLNIQAVDSELYTGVNIQQCTIKKVYSIITIVVVAYLLILASCMVLNL